MIVEAKALVRIPLGYLGEASDLGLAVGKWPRAITVIEPGCLPQRFRFAKLEADRALYTDRRYILTILND